MIPDRQMCTFLMFGMDSWWLPRLGSHLVGRICMGKTSCMLQDNLDAVCMIVLFLVLPASKAVTFAICIKKWSACPIT